MKRAFCLFVCVFAVLSVFLQGCSPPEAPPERPLRIGLRSVVNSLDPLSENTVNGGSIYLNLYDALVQRDRALTLHPALAERWSTPDDLTWIFELRKGVHFHDGAPLTTADVKFSLDRVKNASGVQQSAALAMLDRVEILNDSSVKLVTRVPSSTLLTRLADISILPSGKVAGNNIIPGTGPFKVKDWSSGKFVQMEANPDYWGAKPKIREARFIVFENTRAAAEAFLKNELDILPQIDPDTIEQFNLSNHKNVIVRNDAGLLVLYLAFGFISNPGAAGKQDGNLFRDLRVRQAVYHAVNVDHIIQQIQKGHADPATQLVAPIVYGYNNAIQRLAYDPAKSKQLLSEAGYPRGFDVRLDATNNRYHRDVQTGEAIAADLRAVGIRVQLNPRPLKEWLELRRKGESSFYLAGWVVGSGDASGALDYLLHTPNSDAGYGPANSGGYSNPALDAVIEECGRTMDPRARLKMLKDAMQIAMNDVAVVPLYVEKNLTATRSDILWEPYPDQLIHLNTIIQQ